MRKEFLMGTMLLLPLVAAAADFTPLGLKPGLWESTVTMKIGSPMASIPPEQRAQMEAAMANMPPARRAQMEAMLAGRGQPTVTKVCLTKDSMSRALDFGAQQRKNCQVKVVSSSPTTQQVEMECTTDNNKLTGTMTFEALSPESGKATIQMSQDGVQKMNMTVNTRYLGPDCGDVKPR
jgi:hypothetical protein